MAGTRGIWIGLAAIAVVAAGTLVTVRHHGAEPAGHLYVSSEQGGNVVVVDLGTRQPVATIAVGKRPRGVQVSPDGKAVYVALTGSTAVGPGVGNREEVAADKSADGVGVINAETNTLAKVLKSGSDPEQLAVSADGKRLYVANEDEAGLSVVDVGAGTIIHTVSIGTEPEGVALLPDGSMVLVASETGDRIDVVDTASFAEVGSIPVGGRPRALAISKDGARAIVTLEDAGSVALIDPVHRKLLKTAKLEGDHVRPMGVVLSPDGRTAYVTTGRGKKLFAIDVNACVDEWSVEVGDRPWGVAISPDGRTVYTANGPSNDVSVVDVETHKVVARIPVPGKPWGVALRP